MAITGATAGTSYIKSAVGTYSNVLPGYTIAVWVNLPASKTAATDYIYISQCNGSNQIGLHMAGSSPVDYNGGCVWKCFNGSTIDCTGLSHPGTGWHHLASVANNSAGNITSTTFWVDGVLDNTVTGSVTGLTSGNADGGLYIFSGSITGQLTVAYPAIWSTQLNGTQIAQLANASNPAGADPRSVASANLQSFIDLNFATGSKPDLIAANTAPWTVSTPSFSVVANPFILPSGGGGGSGVGGSLIGAYDNWGGGFS